MRLVFVESKTSEYSCSLKCMDMVNKYSQNMMNKNGSKITISYTCGLFTDVSIENLKKNKINGLIGTQVTMEEVYEKMFRNSMDSAFLNKYSSRDVDNIGGKIRTLFSNNKERLFNEI